MIVIILFLRIRDVYPDCVTRKFRLVFYVMIEIEYSIAAIKTSMFTDEDHPFYLIAEEWVTAENLSVGDKLFTLVGTVAEIEKTTIIKYRQHCGNVRTSNNHHYFATPESVLGNDSICERAPTDPLDLISYNLANKPSNLPNGKPTGDHAGPWVAARYIHRDSKKETIGLGCANNTMCAEDAAVNDLRDKLGDAIELHRGNVVISQAYVRKYSRKGRLVNKMSPCTHCRDNYGSALNDVTMGTSNLSKDARGYLPPPTHNVGK